MIEEKIQQYKKLAYKIANKFSHNNKEYADDIESAAMIGLWKASQKRDLDGDFKSYAGMTIKYNIITEIRNLKQVKGNNKKDSPNYYLNIPRYDHISTDYSHYDDGVNEKLQAEINEKLGFALDAEEEIDNKECQKLVREAIDLLTNKEKETIIALYFDDKSPMELGKEMGCSNRNIQKLKLKAFAKLRDKLSN